MRPQMHQEQTAAQDKTESESSENEEGTKKVKRRKLGADKEMMHAFLSTTEFNPSRLRPRKEIPVLETKASKRPDLKKPAQDVIDFRMVDLSDIDGPSLIGRRVEVYWPDSRRWFRGRVKTFDHQKLVHKVDYDDGDWERLDLKNEVFRMEVFPGENLKIKPECNTGKKVKLPRSKVAGERKLSDGHVKEDDVDVGVREKELEKAGIICSAQTDISIAAHPEVKDKMVEVGAESNVQYPETNLAS
uniref:PTM/DIR17-like Tudor domain-containing protein n=1 Tax=Kalanchoe fedtschenkoi TaxID=63787 RepID=A0A7N0U2S9_KALFE